MSEITAKEATRVGYVGQATGYISGLLGLGTAKTAADIVAYRKESLGGRRTLPGIIEDYGGGMKVQKVLAIDGVK